MTPSPQPRQPRADLNGGGLFLRGIDPARMDTDGRTLLLALVISLLFHAVILGAARQHPLGEINPALLTPQAETIRIHRAPDDVIADDATATGPPIVSANPDLQATKPPTPAEAVNQTLADNANRTPALPRQPSPLLTTPLVGPAARSRPARRTPARPGGLHAPNQPGEETGRRPIQSRHGRPRKRRQRRAARRSAPHPHPAARPQSRRGKFPSAAPPTATPTSTSMAAPCSPDPATAKASAAPEPEDQAWPAMCLLTRAPRRAYPLVRRRWNPIGPRTPAIRESSPRPLRPPPPTTFNPPSPFPPSSSTTPSTSTMTLITS